MKWNAEILIVVVLTVHTCYKPHPIKLQTCLTLESSLLPLPVRNSSFFQSVIHLQHACRDNPWCCLCHYRLVLPVLEVELSGLIQYELFWIPVILWRGFLFPSSNPERSYTFMFFPPATSQGYVVWGTAGLPELLWLRSEGPLPVGHHIVCWVWWKRWKEQLDFQILGWVCFYNC